jgi:hypothetical protein
MLLLLLPPLMAVQFKAIDETVDRRTLDSGGSFIRQ